MVRSEVDDPRDLLIRRDRLHGCTVVIVHPLITIIRVRVISDVAGESVASLSGGVTARHSKGETVVGGNPRTRQDIVLCVPGRKGVTLCPIGKEMGIGAVISRAGWYVVIAGPAGHIPGLPRASWVTIGGVPKESSISVVVSGRCEVFQQGLTKKA